MEELIEHRKTWILRQRWSDESPEGKRSQIAEDLGSKEVRG